MNAFIWWVLYETYYLNVINIEIMKQRYFVIGKKNTGGRPLYRKLITHAESPAQARRFVQYRLPRGFQIIDVQKD